MQAFDIEVMAEKMYALFKKKEALEIKRIHAMVEFFESSKRGVVKRTIED